MCISLPPIELSISDCDIAFQPIDEYIQLTPRSMHQKLEEASYRRSPQLSSAMHISFQISTQTAAKITTFCKLIAWC